MELIRQNPYHVVGILAGANQKTIAKQKSKINAFQKVGKEIVFNEDLKLTEKPNRSNGAIEKAFSNIEINQGKLLHGLFWFSSQNKLDEIALNYLQSGDITKAEEIWNKATNGKPVSGKNFTAINNLGTLKLNSAFTNNSIDFELLKEALILKTELITSEQFRDFAHFVADETYTISQNNELQRFINCLLEEIERAKYPDAKKVPAMLGKFHPKLKTLVSEKLTDRPLHNIERQVDIAKKGRNDNLENGLKLANKLYKETKSDLSSLSEVLGKSDLKYKMIADKLAKEILQCAVDYFQEFREREAEHGGIPKSHSKYAGSGEENDLGKDTMRFFKIAKTTAIGTQTKERIAENIEGLQEWIDNKPEREKQALIGDDLKFIAEKLERFQRLADTNENAAALVDRCKPRLQNIKAELGEYDDFYLKLSSAVVNNAQGMIVSVVNEAQNDHMVQLGLLDGLKSVVRSALKVSERLGAFDMVPELKTQYRKNHSTLKSIASQIGVYSTRTTSSSSRTSYPSSTATATESEGIPDWIKWVGGIILFFILMRACAG